MADFDSNNKIMTMVNELSADQRKELITMIRNLDKKTPIVLSDDEKLERKKASIEKRRNTMASKRAAKNASGLISKPKEKKPLINKKQTQCDEYHEWSDKSKDIPFESSQNGCGKGEKKLAKELDISTPLGGQNSTVDLIHPVMGNISVKDMTNDDCTLGTEGCNDMRKIFRIIVNLFVCWIIKYKSECELAKQFYNDINKKYGSARTTIINGIDRLELSNINLQKLNELLNELKKHKSEKKYESLESEYINDIVNSLGDKSLQDMLDECVRKEATTMKLAIVHKNKGWLFVNDINRLSCPRITWGAPRINYS